MIPSRTHLSREFATPPRLSLTFAIIYKDFYFATLILDNVLFTYHIVGFYASIVYHGINTTYGDTPGAIHLDTNNGTLYIHGSLMIL
mgnify:FL=1